jgi:hypothetical protein
MAVIDSAGYVIPRAKVIIQSTVASTTGQPPLVSFNEANALQFQQTFNAAVSETRIVLLLSPT